MDPTCTRIALGIEYDGSRFCGWQTQPGGCAVQDVVEQALAGIAGAPVATICAGRTDAGVHAFEQVVHFDTDIERPLSAWVRGTNTLLPPGVAVLWSHAVGAAFSARHDARERRYRYVLLNHRVRPALADRRVAWLHAPLDVERMQASARALLGEHDFSAFRSSLCQAKSPVREMHRLDIARRGNYVIFDFAANAFLHHMVRNIVGALLHIGRGNAPVQWMAEVLEGRDRTRAARTAEAAGLYLYGVSYEPQWGLPTGRARGADLLQAILEAPETP